MDLHSFLDQKCVNLKNNDVQEFTMEKYDNFYSFVENHYSLKHMKENNYIKYVKVMRQKLLNNDPEKYNSLIDKINDLIGILFKYNLFPNYSLRKFLFKIFKFLKILEIKKRNIEDTIKYYQKLFDSYNDKDKIKFKILMNINGYITKLQIYNKISKEIKFNIKIFVEMEENFEIDHKLIEINNIERGLIGKKSEYLVDKLIKSFINQSELKYIYIQNIDIIKLFNFKLDEIKNIKGEIDGILVLKKNNEYIIDKIIEVKSSIKATFEDIDKFINLVNKINKLDNFVYYFNDIRLTNKSFCKMLNTNIYEWLIYLCKDEKTKIEKSHFYFSHVLKIVDNEFIKRYYIEHDKSIIDEKFNLITKNKNYVNELFDKWKKLVNLTDFGSSIYLIK